jgi:hypothetical protein
MCFHRDECACVLGASALYYVRVFIEMSVRACYWQGLRCTVSFKKIENSNILSRKRYMIVGFRAWPKLGSHHRGLASLRPQQDHFGQPALNTLTPSHTRKMTESNNIRQPCTQTRKITDNNDTCCVEFSTRVYKCSIGG